MCSLFDQSLSLDELVALYDIVDIPDNMTLKPKNFPKTNIAAIHASDSRAIELMRWGLIPSWSKRDKNLPEPYLARDDKLTSSGMYSESFKSRRCIIPAVAYAEYEGEKGSKREVWLEPTSGPVIALAGLWDEWCGPNQVVRSCTMITTSPNALVSQYNHRMPAVLANHDAIDIWLDVERYNQDELLELIMPCETELIRVRS